MPINPEIPLAVKTPPPFDMMKTMGEMQGLQHVKQEIELNKQSIADRKLEVEKRTRDASDDAAIRSELQNLPQSDDPTNLDAVADRLDAGGHGPAAMKFRGQLLDHRKKQADGAHAELANMEAANKLQAGLLGSVHDEATWQGARRMMRATIAAGGNPDALQQFDQQAPQNFDPNWVKDKMAGLVDHGTQVREKRYSVLEHQWAMEHGQPDADGKVDPKAMDVWASSAGRVLSQARNADEWAQTLASLRQQGAPDAALNRFDAVWSKNSAKRAGDLTMSPQQLRQLGISATTAATGAANSRRGDAEFQWRKDHPTATSEDPTHTGDMAEYNAYVRNHHNAQSAQQKAFHDRMFSDPEADLTEEPPAYEDPQEFDEWRQANAKGPFRPAAAGRAPATPITPIPAGAPQAPAQAGPNPAGPPAPAAAAPAAAAPATPATPKPAAAANSVSIDTTNFKVTMPSQGGKPGKVLKFRSLADMNNALKEAGYGTATPSAKSGQK